MQLTAQRLAIDRATIDQASPGGFDEGRQPVAARWRPHHHGGGGADEGRAAQRRLDLAQFDPQAVDLHLVVLAAEELDGAVGQAATDGAGPVQPFAAVRMPDEGVLRPFPVAPVAPRQTRLGDAEVAGHPIGTGAQRMVERMDALVGQGAVVGDAPPRRIDPVHGLGDGPDGGLGTSSSVVKSPSTPSKSAPGSVRLNRVRLSVKCGDRLHCASTSA